jgi:2-polyprenyl-3-methyl-5-hydroxy-6-metoxy-1,4-benzoquinol methylase
MENTLQQHWEQVYSTKQLHEVSWTQEIPTTSLQYIHTLLLPNTAKIIDIGGGDSKLVDYLLQEGFENITVSDISATALEKAKKRLGAKADKVTWIVSDINNFEPTETYDVWHDRATFHFLTTAEQVHAYLEKARKAVRNYLTIGTISDKGPDKCSGFPVHK